MITIRDATENEVQEAISWARHRGIDYLPNLWGPDRYIAEREGKAVAFAAFSLALASPVMWMEALITNPDFNLGKQSLSEVVHGLIKESFRRHYPSYQVIRAFVPEELAKYAGGFNFFKGQVPLTELLHIRT